VQPPAQLGGEVAGAGISCPGPGHGPRDRSLNVSLSASSPDGFIVHSFAGDDWRDCRDHVRAQLGLPLQSAPRRLSEGRGRRPGSWLEDNGRDEKIAAALALWRGSANPRGTLAETYLRSRGLELEDYIAGEVLRWDARLGAMIALFRNIETDAPQAVSRTYLDRDGRKLDRKFLGPVADAAIKLDADENVLGGLHIGEGVESCLAARQLGLKPTWALGSAGAIAAFPVLGGVDCLTLLAEHDEASARAVETCAARWHAAGREVLINRAIGGKDLNDALRGAA
jgi:putative DNA primase/helicase